jgi:hypothetical protein
MRKSQELLPTLQSLKRAISHQQDASWSVDKFNTAGHLGYGRHV